MSRFQKAVRQKARLRMGIDGPSGSGKSYTALRFAFAFPGARVAAIEAGENGGLSLYQGAKPDGVSFDFDLLELKGNYSPTEYVTAIEEAGREKYDVLIIDSLSHAWAGVGGALDIKDRQGGNDFAAWRKVTPMHNKMIDAILQSPCHIIATIRSKMDYVLEPNEQGRMVPRKVGMKPVQREGMEYEFTIFGSLDHAHILTVSKSRCSAVQDAIVSQPGAGFMTPILAWLALGEDAAESPRPAQAPVQQPAKQPESLSEANQKRFDAMKRDEERLVGAGLCQQFDLLRAASKAAQAEGCGSQPKDWNEFGWKAAIMAAQAFELQLTGNAPASDLQKEQLDRKLDRKGKQTDDVWAKLGLPKGSDLTSAQIEEAMKALDAYEDVAQDQQRKKPAAKK